MTTKLTSTAIRATLKKAQFLHQNQQTERAWRALEPVIADLADQVASDGYNPLMDLDWQSIADGHLIKRWRSSIQEWKDANFEGMTPGQIALTTVLDDEAEDCWPLAQSELTGHVQYQGRHVRDFIQRTCRFVFADQASSAVSDMTSLIEGKVLDAWKDEAFQAGIPSGIRTEFWWVPGWNGDSLDDTEHLHLRGKRYDTTYIDEILPSPGLENFLKWVNVSTDEFIAAATQRNAAEGQALRDNLAGFSVAKDPARSAMVTPEDVVNMIENVGLNQCLPTVHAYVEVSELLKLDPREPIALPLKNGQMHLGWHDTINGAGYMDTYPGTAVIDAMTLGFGGQKRGRYGIDETYGLALSAFYCTPENVRPEPDAAMRRKVA